VALSRNVNLCSCVHSLTQSLIFLNSFIRSLTRSLIHSLIHSPTPLIPHPLTHSLIHPLPLSHVSWTSSSTASHLHLPYPSISLHALTHSPSASAVVYMQLETSRGVTGLESLGIDGDGDAAVDAFVEVRLMPEAQEGVWMCICICVVQDSKLPEGHCCVCELVMHMCICVVYSLCI